MPRNLTEHTVNPANEALLVRAIDEPGHGGASHHYEIAVASVDDPQRDGNPGQPRLLAALHFQNGPVKVDGNGVNGVTHEALLAIVADRLRSFLGGPYSCRENALALRKIEEAQHWLQHRTLERMRRGVEGTHER